MNRNVYVSPAVSARFFLLVPKAQTSVSLSSTPNPSAYGAAVTFAVTTSANTAVTLTDSSSGAALGAVTTDGAGNAVYTTSALQPGTHAVVAAVAASATQSGGSGTVSQVVEPVPTTAVLAVPSPASGSFVAGSSATATVSVAAMVSTGAAPTGTVSFYDNAALVGTGSLTTGPATAGSATLMFTLPAGTSSLTCLYSGDSNYASSSCGGVTINAVQPMQTITFPQPPSPAYAATAVALQASSSAGLPITYTVVSGPATVVGSTLTYGGAGTVVVEADQAGNGTYPAAQPVQMTVPVTILTEPLTVTSSRVTTLVTIQTAGTLATLNASTQGAQGLDFMVPTFLAGAWVRP